MIDPSAPESARRADRDAGSVGSAEGRASGIARDRLHALLDSIEGRRPTSVELASAMALAQQAFLPTVVAARLLTLLWRELGVR